MTNPTLLPQATTAQLPDLAAYAALSVPSLPLGADYKDPSSGVRVVRLTTGAFPAASSFWHDYVEGGDEVSLPLADGSRYVLARGSGGYYILNVHLETSPATVTSRKLSPQPMSDVCFAFSSNPVTPYYAYIATGSQVVRVDLRTMTLAPGSNFPVSGGGQWLHQSKNDELFTWMESGAIVAFTPLTGTKLTHPKTGVNEPRICRGGRYIALSMDAPANGMQLWDTVTNTIVWTLPGDPGFPFAHIASLLDRWLGVQYNVSAPFQYWQAQIEGHVAKLLGGPTNGDLIYANGNWVQDVVAGDQQWALVSTYGARIAPGSGWLAKNGMVYVQPAGGRRLLGFPYNTTNNYTQYAFPKQSSDGAVVLFTSNMQGQGRSDLFLAVLPTTDAPPPPPPPADTIAPSIVLAVGVTPDKTLTLGDLLKFTTTSTDNSGGSGIASEVVTLNGQPITSPYLPPAIGSYTIVATATDKAGNSTSVSQTITVVAPVLPKLDPGTYVVPAGREVRFTAHPDGSVTLEVV